MCVADFIWLYPETSVYPPFLSFLFLGIENRITPSARGLLEYKNSANSDHLGFCISLQTITSLSLQIEFVQASHAISLPKLFRRSSPRISIIVFLGCAHLGKSTQLGPKLQQVNGQKTERSTGQGAYQRCPPSLIYWQKEWGLYPSTSRTSFSLLTTRSKRQSRTTQCH